MGKKPSASLAIGQPAPNFCLPSSDGSTIQLSRFAGGRVVLYFYPKADTPGCTRQACGFRDAMAAFRKAEVVVLGISPDPVRKVKAFAEKLQLNFPLLADEDHAVCERYGVWQEKSMYGRKYWGAMRTTFIIGSAGTIERIIEKVKPEGHELEVMKSIDDD